MSLRRDGTFEVLFRLRETVAIFEVELNLFCTLIWPQVYGGEKVECVLSENVLHRFICLNI